VVITWADDDSWFGIDQAAIDATDAAMGGWYREPTCRVFDVLRA
jgi:hypothetical protein